MVDVKGYDSVESSSRFLFYLSSSGIEQLLRCVADWLHWPVTNRRLFWSLVRRFEHSVTVSLAKRCEADADQLAPAC